MRTILALAVEGKEYMYYSRTARRVSKASAQKICDIVNKHKFLFECYPNCVWHIFEVDDYEPAFDIAEYQSFTIREGIVTARNH